MDVQKPLVAIGTVVRIGDWSGEVVKVTKNGVMVKLDDGHVMPVAKELVEEAVRTP